MSKGNGNAPVIDISDWKMKHFKRWQRAAAAVDIDEMNEMMLDAVIELPGGGVPSADTFDEMTPADWSVLSQAVTTALVDSFRPKDGN